MSKRWLEKRLWELFLFWILCEDNLKVDFSKVEIALRLYLVLLI